MLIARFALAHQRPWPRIARGFVGSQVATVSPSFTFFEARSPAMAGHIIKRGVAGSDDHGAGGIATTIMTRPTMLTAQTAVRRTGIPA
jgi:hypothetical protein